MSERIPVNADEWLYRRGYIKYTNPDGSPTSRVFKLREKDNGELSVDVKSLISAEVSVCDIQRFSLFEIYNQIVIDLGLYTFHDPDDESSNMAHAVIIGMSMDDEIIPGLLARNSKRVYIV